MTKQEKEFEEWFPYGDEHKPFMKEAYLAGRQKSQEEIEGLKKDLQLNASMLAKQTDLAREEETKTELYCRESVILKKENEELQDDGERLKKEVEIEKKISIVAIENSQKADRIMSLLQSRLTTLEADKERLEKELNREMTYKDALEIAESRITELEKENKFLHKEMVGSQPYYYYEYEKLQARLTELEKEIKTHEDLELRLEEDKHKNWLDWKAAESRLTLLEEAVSHDGKLRKVYEYYKDNTDMQAIGKQFGMIYELWNAILEYFERPDKRSLEAGKALGKEEG